MKGMVETLKALDVPVAIRQGEQETTVIRLSIRLISLQSILHDNPKSSSKRSCWKKLDQSQIDQSNPILRDEACIQYACA